MAYRYNLSKKLREILPAHYVKRCVEFDQSPPLAVHWRPAPSKYTVNPKNGERLILQDDPIKVIYPAEANLGLWGGEGLIQGLIKKKRRSPRVVKLWRPFISLRPVYSEILDRWMLITVTMRTLNSIDDKYGFDNYILKSSEKELNSRLGMDLKREMILALANKTHHPDDPKKQQEIYEKYKEYILPVEEAEWLGLSTKEAMIKLRAIQKQQAVVRPLKQIYAESLMQELEAEKDGGEESSRGGWLSKINPFSRSDSQSESKDS